MVWRCTCMTCVRAIRRFTSMTMTKSKGQLIQMDFLGVCDSGDWGDWSDTKDLHAQLFTSRKEPGKKSKAARKKQGTIARTQDNSQQATKKQNHPEKLENISPQKNKDGLQHRQLNDGASRLETGTDEQLKEKKNKKKRNGEINEGSVPMKKHKVQLSSSDPPTEDRKSNLQLITCHRNDNSKASENDRTINPSQKKRKRKPRKNKFKTPEFGFVIVQRSETALSDAEPKTVLPAQSGKLKNKANKTNRKGVKKSSETAKDTDQNTSAKDEDSIQRAKLRNKGSKGAQDSLHSPEQKLKKRISENLDKSAAAAKKEESKSNQRTRLRATFAMGSKIYAKVSKHSKRASAQIDTGHTADSSARKCEQIEDDGSAASVGRGEDTASDSEEPQPDLSAKWALTSKMEAQLNSAHFRFLNEQLYKTTGSQARQMMAQDREAFGIYHQGFSQQVRQWPVNPVHTFIEDLKSRPVTLTVGDFGCGEARIAQSVSQTVYSFDLCALNKHVKVCNMEKVPLKGYSLDVAIFCLSLMGTNWINYIKEANRVLKMNGQLKIAEVASRFTSVSDFLKIMKQLGFKKESKDFSNKMFLMFDFTKEAPSKKVELEQGRVLRPCLYKRR